MNETNATINDTINNALPDLDVKVDTLPDLGDLIEFKDGIINLINDVLEIFTPNTVIIVAVFAVLIGIVFKRKYDEDWIMAIIVAVIVYLALRAIGIGN